MPGGCPASGGVQVLSLALSFSVPSVQCTGSRVGMRRRCQALGGLNLRTMLTDPDGEFGCLRTLGALKPCCSSAGFDMVVGREKTLHLRGLTLLFDLIAPLPPRAVSSSV